MRNPAIFILALITLSAIGATRYEPDASRVRNKARYYYLEGVRAQQEGKPSDAYAYFSHALSVDPSYVEASTAKGEIRIAAQIDTLQSRSEVARSLELMRPFVDQYPEDYNESMLYGFFANVTGNYPEAIRVFSRTEKLHPTQSSTLVNLSRAYAADGNMDSAISALDRFEVMEGIDPNITIQKISYQFAKRDTVNALGEASKLVATNPRDPRFLILKGKVFSMINQPDSALNYLNTAEILNPENGNAKLALADYYREQGDSAKYDLKIYEALSSEDFDLEQKIGLLGDYLQHLLNDSSDTARGDHLFEILRDQYPHNSQLLDLSARYAAAKGNYQEAIDEVGYAISLSPSDEKLRGQLMTYLLAADKPKEVMKEYKEVKKFNSTPMRSLIFLYASAAQMAKEYDEAVEAYGEILHEIIPSLPIDTTITLRQVPASISFEDLQRLSQLYTNIGDSYNNGGNAQKSFNAYENALLLDPDNYLAMNNYAYFLSVQGKDLERAREMSQKSLEGEGGKNPTYLDTYAWILYKAGDYDDALNYQDLALQYAEEADDVSDELYLHYGDILSALHRNKEALEAYEKALKLSPDNHEIKNKIKELKQHHE